jgi:hypothetical protein
MQKPAGSVAMALHSPAAVKKLGGSSVHAQESGAAAAAAALNATNTTAAAAAAAAVPSQDWLWSGPYDGYRPNMPGADNTASCVWNITQLDVQPADSSFFAQKTANATGIW